MSYRSLQGGTTEPEPPSVIRGLLSSYQPGSPIGSSLSLRTSSAPSGLRQDTSDGTVSNESRKSIKAERTKCVYVSSGWEPVRPSTAPVRESRHCTCWERHKWQQRQQQHPYHMISPQATEILERTFSSGGNTVTTFCTQASLASTASTTRTEELPPPTPEECDIKHRHCWTVGGNVLVDDGTTGGRNLTPQRMSPTQTRRPGQTLRALHSTRLRLADNNLQFTRTRGLPPSDDDERVLHMSERNVRELLHQYTGLIQWMECKGKLVAEPFIRRSTLYALLGEHEKSMDDARCAVGLNDGFSAGYYRLGLASYRLGRYSEAADALREGLRRSPTCERMRQAFTAALEMLHDKRGLILRRPALMRQITS